MSLWRLTRRQDRASLNRYFDRWNEKLYLRIPQLTCIAVNSHPKRLDAVGWSVGSTTSDPRRFDCNLDQAQCHSSFAGTLRFKDEANWAKPLMQPNPAPDKSQISEYRCRVVSLDP